MIDGKDERIAELEADLSDLHMIIRHCAEIYDEAVIAVMRDLEREAQDEAIAEATEELREQMAVLVSALKGWHRYWEPALRDKELVAGGTEFAACLRATEAALLGVEE